MDSTITAYKPRPRRSIVAREGYPFIAIALFASLAMHFAGLEAGMWILIGVAAFIVYFFRNPERNIPAGEGLVVSPADGRVLAVTKNVNAPHTGVSSTKVSIFMSVMNVHINRFPVAASVVKAIYMPGKFFVASLDKASEHNERNALVLKDEEGREFVMVQIAGIVARRIVCYMKEGDFLARGERFGLIRFGSRVDLYFPPEADICARPGEKVRAGETIIGRFS